MGYHLDEIENRFGVVPAAEIFTKVSCHSIASIYAAFADLVTTPSISSPRRSCGAST